MFVRAIHHISLLFIMHRLPKQTTEMYVHLLHMTL
jgi:hypothetical protein